MNLLKKQDDIRIKWEVNQIKRMKRRYHAFGIHIVEQKDKAEMRIEEDWLVKTNETENMEKCGPHDF